jgi:hypothetical protein
MSMKAVTSRIKKLIFILKSTTMGWRPLSEDAIVELLTKSNLKGDPPANRTSRWRGNVVTVHIATPAVGNSTHDRYCKHAQRAMAKINRKLGKELLRLAGQKEADIRITFGTAYVKAGETNYQEYAANVSSVPKWGHPISCDDGGEIETKPVYLQLGHERHGQDACDCAVTEETVIHEFGHALGLDKHFEGFGTGSVISRSFWDVLATLYAHGPGKPFNELTGRRAKMTW